MADAARTNWQQTLSALSAAAAAVLIPIVLAIVGNRYTVAIKEREIEGRFVELALNILKDALSQKMVIRTLSASFSGFFYITIRR